VVNGSSVSGELDIEYDRTTSSPSITARNVQNWPAAYAKFRSYSGGMSSTNDRLSAVSSTTVATVSW